MSDNSNRTADRLVHIPERELTSLRADLAALRAALLSQIEWWERVPSGVDYEADPTNESPADTTAHIAGLAIREARAAIEASGNTTTEDSSAVRHQDGAALAPATGSPLKGEALEILKHTARTGRYVCDPDADTHLLVTLGYLRDHDAQALAGGMHYYTITHLGKAALRRANAEMSHEPERRT